MNDRIRGAAIQALYTPRVDETTSGGMMASTVKGMGTVKPVVYSPPDEDDGHVHQCDVDERGEGTTGVGGRFPHWHSIHEGRVSDYFIDAGGVQWTSSHLGKLEGRDS